MPATHRICIAGTDTDAGKTIITAGLARLARKKGLRTLVIKPVQTGAVMQKNGEECGLVAPDLVLCSMAAPGIETRSLDLFENACSPHLAARKAGRSLSVGNIIQGIQDIIQSTPADVVFLEGAGGIFAPVNESETYLDVFSLLGWPVLLVSANRLGTINHTLLSLGIAQSGGLDCLGVIMNQISAPVSPLDQEIRQDNADIIARLGNVPCLASVEYIADLDIQSSRVNAQAWDKMADSLVPVLEKCIGVSPPQESTILGYDREHLWHPYTSTEHPLRVREAVAARGVRIKLKDGRELIDGMASWWCAIHGYGHPRMVRALEKQARTMAHVMFGGLTHEPAVGLAKRLLSRAPQNLRHVFFSDSGSVSVEVAIKMAMQYHQATGNKQRTRLLTIRGGYHGDTFGAMSVCDPENGMHSLFTGILPQHIFVPRPTCRYGAPYDTESEQIFEKAMLANRDTIAAVILEPVVQGAGGMWFYHPSYLRRVRELCSQNGCLLILDEIATGFGRTGKMFACEHADIAPDILCVGKGLTGGVLSLGATLASEEVARGIAADGGVLAHGPTFMANPLACAAACASLDILDEGQWAENVLRIEALLRTGLVPCAKNKDVADVRVLGAIGVVEMKMPVNVEGLQTYFVDQWGVWIRPFGKLIYIMPPYITTNADVDTLTEAIRSAVSEEKWK
jgi:adenosylmethionine-8-amino-7-oxononanoate aminotransferase